jgi:hypothetical protein
VLEPRSRRPKSSPATLTEHAQADAVAMRKALQSSGLNMGDQGARHHDAALAERATEAVQDPIEAVDWPRT